MSSFNRYVFFIVHFLLNNCCLFRLCYSTKPNIVLIIVDDVGHNDVSYYGSNQIPTPNIDALAYNGIILNRFYTQTTCTPSRTALLTGQYPIRFGMQGTPLIAGQNRHLPFGTNTLPKMLKEFDYDNYLIGKWHLGAAFKNATPLGMGFDHHFGYWNGYIGYFDHLSEGKNSSLVMEGYDMHDDLRPAWSTKGEYATRLFTQKAVEVIEKRDGTKPFFLQIAHLAGHAGVYDKLEVVDQDENDILFSYIQNEKRRLYAGMIRELDLSVGKIIDALSQKGLLDNTLVLFISDNGAQTEGIHENFGSNWPYRGLKFSIHEGGIRNLAFIYGKDLQGEKINDGLMHISDLMPTLYAAAGGDPSILDNIDGVSQWETLTQDKPSPRENILINIDELKHSSGFIGERGQYKIINGSTVIADYDLYYGESGRSLENPPYNVSEVLNSLVNVAIDSSLDETTILKLREKVDLGNCRTTDLVERCTVENICLFDLIKDPCETTNIAASNPLVLEKLKSQLRDYWSQLQPQVIARVDEKANPIYCNNSWFPWLDDNKEEWCQ